MDRGSRPKWTGARTRAAPNRQRLVLEEEVARHGGVVGPFYGDGTPTSFPGAVEVAQAAVAVQTRLPEAPRISLRIGVHPGDLLQGDHGVLGDGIRVAARVQSLAVPGSVLVSDRLQEELANPLHLPTASLGRVQFEGLPRTMVAFALQGARTLHAPPGSRGCR